MTAGQRLRLIVILGRLGSEFDGERAAAELLAARFLRNTGVMWEGLLSRTASPQPKAASNSVRALASGSSPQVYARWAVQHSAWLQACEIQFLRSVSQRRRPLTEKQGAWRHGIIGRLQVEMTNNGGR